jgi:hypothetical protein
MLPPYSGAAPRRGRVLVDAADQAARPDADPGVEGVREDELAALVDGRNEDVLKGRHRGDLLIGGGRARPELRARA